MTALVLMYHRVCASNAGTACYFARGTAVTPGAFLRHMDWLGERLRIVSLPDALRDSAAGMGRWIVVLTF